MGGAARPGGMDESQDAESQLLATRFGGSGGGPPGSQGGVGRRAGRFGPILRIWRGSESREPRARRAEHRK